MSAAAWPVCPNCGGTQVDTIEVDKHGLESCQTCEGAWLIGMREAKALTEAGALERERVAAELQELPPEYRRAWQTQPMPPGYAIMQELGPIACGLPAWHGWGWITEDKRRFARGFGTMTQMRASAWADYEEHSL